MSFATGGAFPASLTPTPTKTLFAGNYLSIGSNDFDFTKQFLPELYEAEVERYGNRTVSSFLRQTGSEFAMQSDEIVWSEQGRLHISYNDAKITTVNDSGDNNITITGHAIRANQTILVNKGYDTVRAFVKQVVDANTIEAFPYDSATWPAGFVAAGTNPDLNVFVFGSEFAKKTDGMSGSVDAGFEKYTNKPVIIKDSYSVSGSDMAQIGWVEVTTEGGDTGYLWYLKSAGETSLRFDDYLEMMLVESEKAAVSITDSGSNSIEGTEGLFSAIESRGLVFNDHDFDNASGFTGLAEFDTILKQLDKQGAIEDNMMYLDRGTSLSIDNMLARQNGNSTSTGNWGVFNNSSEMGLNLGFQNFARGTYQFYKTDWKYLNDAATRGSIADVEGVMIPAGTQTVYENSLGKNMKRPFLHVRYRANEQENRRRKSWVTGSAGGASNSTVDEMNIQMLSERCLCVQGANNFITFKATQA